MTIHRHDLSICPLPKHPANTDIYLLFLIYRLTRWRVLVTPTTAPGPTLLLLLLPPQTRVKWRYRC